MRPTWTIVFDFGNTLAPFNDREAEAVTADLAAFVQRRLGLAAAAFTRLWTEEREADFRRSAVTGVEHDFGARLARVLERAGEAAETALRAEAEECVAESFVRHVRVDRQVSASVSRLVGRCRLGVLSNYLLAAPIHRVLARDGVHACFDKVIVSKEVGFAKPHPRCFEAILEALAPEPERAVYVGDDYDADVVGAIRAGMRAVWTWAMRDPRPAEPESLPRGACCVRTREEYLGFLRDPEGFLACGVGSL